MLNVHPLRYYVILCIYEDSLVPEFYSMQYVLLLLLLDALHMYLLLSIILAATRLNINSFHSELCDVKWYFWNGLSTLYLGVHFECNLQAPDFKNIGCRTESKLLPTYICIWCLCPSGKNIFGYSYSEVATKNVKEVSGIYLVLNYTNCKRNQ